MNLDWATWALQFLIVLGIGRVWLAIDKNTEKLGDLREEIPKTYATRRDTDRHHDEDKEAFAELHQRLDSTSARAHNLDLRLTALDGSVREAQAGLRTG